MKHDDRPLNTAAKMDQAAATLADTMGQSVRRFYRLLVAEHDDVQDPRLPQPLVESLVVQYHAEQWAMMRESAHRAHEAAAGSGVPGGPLAAGMMAAILAAARDRNRSDGDGMPPGSQGG